VETQIEKNTVVKDYGSNMKLVWTTDQEAKAATTYANVGWNKFKNGTKNRIFMKQLDKKQCYEYVMQFNLEAEVEISEIQLGVLYNWSTYDQDCQYEPLTIIVEGGLTKERPDWKALLRPYDDNGYKMNSITPYGICFTTLGHGSSMEERL